MKFGCYSGDYADYYGQCDPTITRVCSLSVDVVQEQHLDTMEK